MVDLDSNKLTPARVDAELPMLPEPEGTILKNHLKQVKISWHATFYRTKFTWKPRKFFSLITIGFQINIFSSLGVLFLIWQPKLNSPNDEN